MAKHSRLPNGLSASTSIGLRKGFDWKLRKKEAAVKARDIYLALVAKGLVCHESTNLLRSLCSQSRLAANLVTVGENSSRKWKERRILSRRHFANYASCLRQLAAYVQGVKSDASRFDYRKGGVTVWRGQVDATPLSAITPSAVADLEDCPPPRAGSDPRRKLEVNRSFNSWLRNTKSLFSDAIICKPKLPCKSSKIQGAGTPSAGTRGVLV